MLLCRRNSRTPHRNTYPEKGHLPPERMFQRTFALEIVLPETRAAQPQVCEAHSHLLRAILGPFNPSGMELFTRTWAKFCRFVAPAGNDKFVIIDLPAEMRTTFIPSGMQCPQAFDCFSVIIQVLRPDSTAHAPFCATVLWGA